MPWHLRGRRPRGQRLEARPLYLAVFASGALSVFISSAFAQSPFGAGGTESLMSFLPIVLMFGVLYFLMIRPQMKRQKEHKQMIDSLAKGDEVLAASGMVGKISKIGEAYVSVEVARVSVERGPDQVFEVQMQKSAVQQVLPKGTIKAIQ
ncbi:MAG: preprotein translocase subunit YajC [Betaproteobacteria bacterium]|nr:preprotein translocase subunit YajC [Betaproteobacteria bacterium]